MIKNGIQLDIAYMKGQMRVIIPLLIMILASIISLVGIMIHYVMTK